jgi:hypothetical protein
MKILEYLKDKYLTWNTGKGKAQREWEAWYNINVVLAASTIENMFMHFKHVIVVDVQKFMDHREPFAWIPNDEVMQYFWPNKPLGENTIWRFERVRLDRWDGKWHIDEFGGEDKLYVATNNDTDAMMIALQFT